MSCCKACNLVKGESKRQAVLSHFGGKNAIKQVKENRPPEGTPCEKCKTPMVYKRCAQMMCFDHDPDTNKFRGWLCQNCNTGIGKLGDNLEGLLEAVRYLSTTVNEPSNRR